MGIWWVDGDENKRLEGARKRGGRSTNQTRLHARSILIVYAPVVFHTGIPFAYKTMRYRQILISRQTCDFPPIRIVHDDKGDGWPSVSVLYRQWFSVSIVIGSRNVTDHFPSPSYVFNFTSYFCIFNASP